jgi:pimeloyl-ACP methyl ester carboxylesterase
MPYPHGFGKAPVVQGPLAAVLREQGLRVVSFDPPGAFYSTRPAQVSMPEMLGCAQETLHTLNLRYPLILAGHSIGGLCAIAGTLAHPEWVKKLVLIGTLSGGSAISGAKGMPWGRWLTGLDRWRFTFYGMRLNLGMGNLEVHKRLRRLLDKASYHDKRLIPITEIADGDNHRPAPVRDRWARVVMTQRLEYRERLGDIRAPTLVCVGRFDPQAPVGCSQEPAQSIPGARLEIFENSGHYPFIEEREKFKAVISEFI